MEFVNSLLTEKSWSHLQQLAKKKFNFVLIGGWAAYLWTRLHKSKNIEIVLKNVAELEAIRKEYALNKNDNLKKNEIKFEEIDVDVYVPYFSKLAIPVEDIPEYATTVENISVVKPEVLLLLKQGAEIDRKDSVKGQKDRIDIMTLLCFAEIDFKGYHTLAQKYGLHTFPKILIQIIK